MAGVKEWLDSLLGSSEGRPPIGSGQHWVPPQSGGQSNIPLAEQQLQVQWGPRRADPVPGQRMNTGLFNLRGLLDYRLGDDVSATLDYLTGGPSKTSGMAGTAANLFQMVSPIGMAQAIGRLGTNPFLGSGDYAHPRFSGVNQVGGPGFTQNVEHAPESPVDKLLREAAEASMSGGASQQGNPLEAVPNIITDFLTRGDRQAGQQTGTPGNGGAGNPPPDDKSSTITDSYDPVAAMPPNMRRIYDNNNANAQRMGMPQPFTYREGYQPRQPLLPGDENAALNQANFDNAQATMSVVENPQLMRVYNLNSNPQELEQFANEVRSSYASQGIPTAEMADMSDTEVIMLWNEEAQEYNRLAMAEAARARQEAAAGGN